MSEIGRTLFAGSPFIRWTVGPVAVATAVGLPLLVPAWTPAAIGVVAVLELGLVSLALAVLLPGCAGWASRILCGLVFGAYGAYFVSEVVTDPASLLRPARKSEATAFNALLGLIVIGTPCLVYALLGRFTLRAEITPEPGPDDDRDTRP